MVECLNVMIINSLKDTMYTSSVRAVDCLYVGIIWCLNETMYTSSVRPVRYSELIEMCGGMFECDDYQEFERDDVHIVCTCGKVFVRDRDIVFRWW